MESGAPYWLPEGKEQLLFPHPRLALEHPNGLLAVGGDLTSQRLLFAYRNGIFPWYSEGEPILWWSPDPRMVLFTADYRPSRSLRKRLRKGDLRVTFDTAFDQVIEACAAPRARADGTWILPEMQAAYRALYRQGHAHSVECWRGEELVGGLYGVAIGRVFFGESMFSRTTDASKTAFANLVWQLHRWGFPLIDGQVGSEHLESLGFQMIPRAIFLEELAKWCEEPGLTGPWQLAEANPWA